jgi:sigma-B regulation protein RsbU (phosphoserine phosphatase)
MSSATGGEELDRYDKLVLTIQRAILPQQLPTVPGLDLAVHFADVEDAGGDYYDVYPAGPNRWAIVIADVIGHGLAAAAILALVHALATPFRANKYPSPRRGPGIDQQTTGRSVTWPTRAVCYCLRRLYDADAQVLTYASAGHPPPRLIRGNQVHRLVTASGLPLESIEQAHMGMRHYSPAGRPPGTVHGRHYPESANASHDLFGDERLDANLRAPANTATELLERIVDSVRTFRVGRPAGDDETCLVAVVKSDPADTQEPRK